MKKEIDVPIDPQKLHDKNVARAIAAHGNRYNFSNVVFTELRTRTTFNCPTHGDFKLSPESLFNGSYCPLCTKEDNKVKFIKEFIEKANKLHNNKYSYDKLNFTATKEHVTITCPIHGDQSMFMFTHLTGVGCPLCSREQAKNTMRSTTDEFIIKSKKIHGNTYEYDKVNYDGVNKTVTIICKKHGEFNQLPSNHLAGAGCPICAKEAITDTLETFISKAKNIHGDKYNYDKVVYKNTMEKVIITCPLHGDFEQTPSSHINAGQGCQKCYDMRRGQGRKVDDNTFITRAKELHGDRYDYSKVSVGKTTKEPVIIICPEHGEFYQSPFKHLEGNGCSKCSGKYQRNTEEYIHDAKLIHGDKYGYDKTVYVNNTTPIIIKCPKHGYVNASPKLILRGNGCPVCNESVGENLVSVWLSKNSIEFIRQFRILPYRYRYDFYLPKLNILIEYDGIQHYLPIKFFGGDLAFADRRRNDIAKDNLAKQYNIGIIRIPYSKQSSLDSFLNYKISYYYKYRYGNIFYKNFMELCRALNLHPNTTLEDVKQYLVFKQ